MKKIEEQTAGNVQEIGLCRVQPDVEESIEIRYWRKRVLECGDNELLKTIERADDA